MASRSAIPCEHELRPGTTVCLRCQHAERAAKRARQRRMFARGGAATVALGMIVAVGIAAVGAWRARLATSARAGSTTGLVTSSAPDDSAGTAADASMPEAASVMATAASLPTELPASPTSGVTGPSAASPTLAPVIPLGRTMLRDTMLAERVGDTVRVSFDLLLSRTRRPDKFEAIMRATLPQVYGAMADSALRSLPQGSVARAGDLLATLPERGLRIAAAGGTTIAVWPELRAGRDGPLVVAYRALASP